MRNTYDNSHAITEIYYTLMNMSRQHSYLKKKHFVITLALSTPTALSELFFEFNGSVATSTCYLAQRVCFLSHLSSGILPGPKDVLLLDNRQSPRVCEATNRRG